MPTIDRITVYPIKSLDGHDLSRCEVLPGGALAMDRRYALQDGWGKYINGKNCAAIHSIRATYSADLQRVSLSCDGESDTFELSTEGERLAAWCGEVLSIRCRIVENAETGFPDDLVSPGPTLVSTASLEALAGWYEGFDLAEARRRFRFNIEVGNAPAFWEDGLVPELQKMRLFRTGNLVWQGRGVCQRCVVPTRDSHNGAVTAGFARTFSQHRRETLPSWATISRFDHFYRLGVNTSLDSSDNGNHLCVGDSVERID